jgi:hypothetical protein
VDIGERKCGLSSQKARMEINMNDSNLEDTGTTRQWNVHTFTQNDLVIFRRLRESS